jgi:hypothetical protein
MPGKGEVMDGAMQQAAQEGRQIMGRDYSGVSLGIADLIGRKYPSCNESGRRQPNSQCA